MVICIVSAGYCNPHFQVDLLHYIINYLRQTGSSNRKTDDYAALFILYVMTKVTLSVVASSFLQQDSLNVFVPLFCATAAIVELNSDLDVYLLEKGDFQLHSLDVLVG